jgi:hypothetical protein
MPLGTLLSGILQSRTAGRHTTATHADKVRSPKSGVTHRDDYQNEKRAQVTQIA